MSKEQSFQELIVSIAKEYVGGGKTLDELVAVSVAIRHFFLQK